MALATVSSPLVARATADLPNPNLRSNAFYIVDASDSKVLAARNERSAAPIASITKLMTALVVLDAHQPMDEIITITREDVRDTAKSGSRLAPGVRLPRSDLMRLALMRQSLCEHQVLLHLRRYRLQSEPL